MVYSKLDFSSSLFDYQLIFKDRLTLITNESGAGKTLLYKALEDFVTAMNKKDVIFFNYRDRRKGIDSNLLFKPNTLVVIDNAPILIDKNIALQITMNLATQYIVLTHKSDVYKYKPGFSNLAELRIKNDDTVVLDYLS